MRDGIIYDCPNANCRTPIYTGKCSKACIEKHNKEMGIKPKTNADRIRAMSDEELYLWAKKQIGCGFNFFPCGVVCDGKCESFDDETCKAKIMKWLQQPAEGE